MSKRSVTLSALGVLVLLLVAGVAVGSPSVAAVCVGIGFALFVESLRPRPNGFEGKSRELVTDFSSDAPIRTASEDLLRRGQFAERIAQVLSATTDREGRVFAIRGNWGDGKSSLKNLIIEKLDAAGYVEWVEFNPWQWGDYQSIARALFSQIAAKLGGARTPEAEKRARAMRRYGALLVGGASKLRAVGTEANLLSWLTALAMVAAGLGFSWPGIQAKYIITAFLIASGAILIVGMLLNYFGRDKENVVLDDARADIEDRLSKAGKPLVVFVDDIDRLEPEQIRMLLRHVKVNANLPNIVFILLFQPSIVEAALEPIAGKEGRQFLEKIVQANFDLPAVPSNQVHRIFTEQLDVVAGPLATQENGFDEVRWGNVLIGVLQPHIQNLRDARRLLSSIAIHLPLQIGSEAFEVNIIDFFALETFRVFEPDFHDRIFRERDLLLQKHRYSGDRREDEHRRRVTEFLNIVPENRREAAKEALTELFPQVAWVFDNTHFGDSWIDTWINTKRVCTDRFFDRYFELQAHDAEISESEFVKVLSASGDATVLDEVIAEIQERGRTESLVTRLDESVKRLPIENADNLLPVMFRITQSLHGVQEGEVFGSPWVRGWRSISWYLDRIPAEERLELVLKAFRSTRAMSVVAILIHLDEASRKEDSDRERGALFDDEGVAALKTAWLAQLRTLIKDSAEMLTRSDLVSLLYRWRDYTGAIDEPKAWVRKVSRSDAGLAAALPMFMSTGTSHSVRDRVSRKRDYFQRETIEDFFGIAQLDKRLSKLNLTQLSSDQLKAIEVLKLQLDVWTGRATAGPEYFG